MTKKDFELTAEVLRGISPKRTRKECADRFASRFAYINPRFDRERFFSACGL